jgi:hypothetical protein
MEKQEDADLKVGATKRPRGRSSADLQVSTMRKRRNADLKVGATKRQPAESGECLFAGTRFPGPPFLQGPQKKPHAPEPGSGATLDAAIALRFAKGDNHDADRRVG